MIKKNKIYKLKVYKKNGIINGKSNWTISHKEIISILKTQIAYHESEIEYDKIKKEDTNF